VGDRVEGGGRRALQRQELHGKLPTGTTPSTRDEIAEPGSQVAAVGKRDGAERGRRTAASSPKIVRDRGRKACGDEVELGMIGEPGARDGRRAGDAERASRPRRGDDSPARNSRRQRLVEPRRTDKEGREDAVAPRLSSSCAQIWGSERPAGERFAGEIADHALGCRRRLARRADANHQMAGRARVRHSGQRAVPERAL